MARLGKSGENPVLCRNCESAESGFTPSEVEG